MAEESTRNVTESANGTASWAGTARYEILGCLGQGGMGIVYEAFDRQRHERVALKKLLHVDATSLYRFKQEFRAIADVLHPNLVHLHELIVDEHDQVLFTMELVEGHDFLGRVQKRRSRRVAEPIPDYDANSHIQPARKALASEPDADARDVSPADFDKLRPALLQLVEGVRALHASGKLHRDLKPSNVRVTHEGRVVILDFGVATELKRAPDANRPDEEIVGTVTYMAPEQALGEAPVAASDWYSVGAMLYESMVGSPPFHGSPLEILSLKSTVTPKAPAAAVHGVPDDLNALCMALLDPDPETRPTAVDILRRLGAARSDRAPAREIADSSEATPLVGRANELLALKDAFEATREGRSIAVRLSSATGLGKSAIANHFLDELERRGDVLVLRGRVHQRETMPYKAVDSVIDALSRHLVATRGSDRAAALPHEIRALSHVFPVLRRVHDVGEDAQAPTGDPQVIRQLAFDALRELFTTLTNRLPVIVFIDDVQWGDTDSAALLLDLMRPPGAPSVLLLTTHRTEEAETSPFLNDLRARWPEQAEVREVTIGPLELADARRLALVLLGSDDASARQTAEGIARESGGSPFLLEELARSASGYHRVVAGEGQTARASFTLKHLLGERIERLPDDARRVLELVAIGGRPLPISSVGVATGVEESVTQLVAILRTRRFVRTSLRDGQEVVEVSHDRIRDTIVGQLPATTVRDHHAQLARVLEVNPDSDPEAIATHLMGAGDRERAAHYAERAAEQAIAKLAFAQAARLFQLTCDTIHPSSPNARRLQRRVAEASEWAGHAEKAARAYIAAAEGAPTLERVELEGMAAAQLIAAGRIDESIALSRRVLAAIGRRVPDTVVGTMFWVFVYRVVSMLQMRAPIGNVTELPLETKVRLNALHAFGRGLAVVDPFASLYVKIRNLVDALRAGSRTHVIRAAAAEASGLAGAGGPVSKRERRLFELSISLAKESKDGAGIALYQITYGICEYLRGRWTSAVGTLDQASAMLAAARRWQANAPVFAVYALVYLGDLRAVQARTARLVADAERRGDLYTVVNLRASHPIAVFLAADDVEGARKHIAESISQWSKTRFLIQHWQTMVWEAEASLYAGEGVRAWERLARDAQALRKSHVLGAVQLVRVFTHSSRGRAAIASLAGLPASERPARLAEARRALRLLERESLPWTAALTAIVGASLAKAEGDRSRAEQTLRRAIELADVAEMALHAAAARYQLGTLLGDEQGITMAYQAEEAMLERGVRVPERYAQMLVPGSWRATADSAS